MWFKKKSWWWSQPWHQSSTTALFPVLSFLSEFIFSVCELIHRWVHRIWSRWAHEIWSKVDHILFGTFMSCSDIAYKTIQYIFCNSWWICAYVCAYFHRIQTQETNEKTILSLRWTGWLTSKFHFPKQALSCSFSPSLFLMLLITYCLVMFFSCPVKGLKLVLQWLKWIWLGDYYFFDIP